MTVLLFFRRTSWKLIPQLFGLLRLDGDLARLGRLVLGQLDGQDAVLQPGVDLVRVDGERQRQCAAERAETALLPVPDPALGRRRPALALERQLVAARDVDLQVLELD